MAVLENIRKRSSLLILVIGLALFAFIISGVIQNRSLGGVSNGNSIGSVDGEEINLKDFQQSVENASRGNSNSQQMSVVNYIWDYQVNKELLSQAGERMGIRIDRSLLSDIITDNPTYKSYYSSIMGESDNLDMAQYYNMLASVKSVNPAVYSQWIKQEEYVLDQIQNDAYILLVRAGTHHSILDAEQEYYAKNTKVDITAIKIPYTNIADSLVDVADSEILAYLKEHSKEYQQKASVDLQYVFFEEKASEEDENNIKSSLTKLLEPQVVYDKITEKNDTILGFSEVEDYKNFVNKNSDKAFQDKYIFESQLPKDVASDIISLKPNDVFGPYKDGDSYKLVRKIGMTKIADSVKASHIIVPFIGSQRASSDAMTKTRAKAYIDSIYKLVRTNKTKFAQVADSINTDGTSGKAGDIGWVVYSKIDNQSFDKNFSDFIFFNPKNTVKVVETAFGYHIIRIDDMGSKLPAYKLATISRHIEPSEETINETFRKATTFELDVTENAKTFAEATKDTDYKVLTANKVDIGKTSLSQVANPRTIIRWAFSEDTALKTIKRFNTIDGYVIVQLIKRHDEGLMDVSEAKPSVLPILQKRKKAKKIIDKYRETSYQDFIDKDGFSEITANDLTLKSYSIPNLGREPKVLGTALGLNENDTSSLIEGDNGVYIVRVIKKTKPDALDSYDEELQNMPKDNAYFVKQQLTKALKDDAEIEDYRILFY